MMLLIGLGGAAGAFLRYQLGVWLLNRTTLRFPLGTFICNLSGSILLGILLALHQKSAITDTLWLLTGVGFCGAFTTFSTFGYEVTTLLSNKKYGVAMIYITSSVILGLIGAYLGMEAIRKGGIMALLT